MQREYLCTTIIDHLFFFYINRAVLWTILMMSQSRQYMTQVVMGLNPTTASELLLTLEHHRHFYLLFFVLHSIYFSSHICLMLIAIVWLL